MKFLSNFYVILFFVLFAFASCNEDDVEPENEEEVITTLTYTLSSTDGQVAILSFQDLDGDGGAAGTITTSELAANTTYTGIMTLLNETESPAENVTEEIQEEDDEHQIFFGVSGVDLTVDYTDVDGDGNPVGLATTLTTGDAGSGTLTVTLRHEPNKPNNGSLGDAGGETDIEVEFPVTIQ